MSVHNSVYYFPTLNVYANTLKECQTFLCEELKDHVRLPDKTIKFVPFTLCEKKLDTNDPDNNMEIGTYLTFNDKTEKFELYECSMKQFGWVYGWVSNNVQKRLKLLTTVQVKSIVHLNHELNHETSPRDSYNNENSLLEKEIVRIDSIWYYQNDLVEDPEQQMFLQTVSDKIKDMNSSHLLEQRIEKARVLMEYMCENKKTLEKFPRLYKAALVKLTEWINNEKITLFVPLLERLS